MGKYDPLREHLNTLTGYEWNPTFSAIEKVLGFKLPASARTHQAWWANDRHHTYSSAWLDAGWRTESLNLTAERISFRRTGLRRSSRAQPLPVSDNRERIGRALELLREGLIPFVERNLDERLGHDWPHKLDATREHPLKRAANGHIAWDSHALLKTMVDNWQGVFRFTLGHQERAYVGELLTVRNRFAHEERFNSDDAYRALDTAWRLLHAVSARAQAEQLEREKSESR